MKTEEKKELMVCEADTVADPRTVMIHLENASIALSAMMGTFGFYELAHEAVAIDLSLGIEFLGAINLFEVLAWVLGQKLGPFVRRRELHARQVRLRLRIEVDVKHDVTQAALTPPGSTIAQATRLAKIMNVFR
jgi:hypothetical protein